MKKELTAVKNKIQKLKDKKALIDQELEPLFISEKKNWKMRRLLPFAEKTISQLQI